MPQKERPNRLRLSVSAQRTIAIKVIRLLKDHESQWREAPITDLKVTF